MTPQSRISLNIHAQRISNRGRFFQFVRDLNPVAVVVLDEPGMALDIADKLPECQVIFRFNGDGGDGDLHRKYKPEEWLAKISDKVRGDKRIILYTTNEPKLDKALIDWHSELIPLANAQGWRLCVLNLAVGNPEPEKRDDKGNITQESQWEIARSLLELLATNRQHVLGLHEYAGGVVTSGLIGGNPKFIAPGEWPSLVPFTRWHMGRNRFLMEYCARHNIKPPRIILTEHGFDNTSDIKPWLETLQRTPPYPDIRGWRSLMKQWKAWWPMWTAEQAYAEQLLWADKALYQGTPVEAQCIFCYGDAGGWEQFNVEDATDLHKRLIAYAKESGDVYPILPLPYADWRHAYASVQAGADYANLRARPVVDDTPPIAKIFTGDEVWFIPDVRYEEFIAVRKNGLIGWASDSVLAFMDIKPPPDDEEPGTTPVEPAPDEIALQKEIDARTKIAEAYNTISIELKRLALAEADLIEVLKARKDAMRLRRVA